MPSRPIILVVDDEPRIVKLLTLILRAAGFRTVAAADGDEALQRFDSTPPDAVLLDVILPGLDGLEVMAHIQERRSTPVILLSARASAADIARGLDLGADDYITKPFHPDELAARVHAALRRAAGAEADVGVIAFDDVSIDLDRHVVRRAGEPVRLSRTEWTLLLQLAAHAGKVLSHAELLTTAWGPEYRDEVQYLRVWIDRLRRKLGAARRESGRIRSIEGIGYMLDVGDDGGDGDSTNPEGPSPDTSAVLSS